MKPSTMLKITSMVSVCLFLFHLTDDIIHGWEPGGLQNLIGGTLIMVIWLCGALLLSERRAGYVITLLGSLLAFGVAAVHMNGARVGGEFAKTSGAFFFVWTLLALGLTGAFGIVLSVRGLWNLRRGQAG